MAPSAVIPSSLQQVRPLRGAGRTSPALGPLSSAQVSAGAVSLFVGQPQRPPPLALAQAQLAAAAFQRTSGARSTDPPPLIMSAPSDWEAYGYAKFLVDIFPDDAIEILCKRSSCDVIKLVEQQVDRACIKLGGGSKNEIKGMIENRQWDELKALRVSPTPSMTTPRGHRRAGTGQTLPPTPSSTTSGSPQSQRIPSYEWIFAYHMDEPVRLTARPSGSEEYLIGEDKLERFQSLTANWTIPPKKVKLGGQLIEVAQSVHLTWHRPEDAGTSYSQFWVVRPELIRHADILLGYRKQQSQDGRDKGL
jgi:hypothetical protein